MPYPYQIKSYDQYKADYKRSIEDPAGFWGEIAENFTWRKKWEKVWNEVKYCSDRCRSQRSAKQEASL